MCMFGWVGRRRGVLEDGGGGGFAREVEKRVTGMGVGGLNMVACTGENPRRRRIVCAGSEGIKVKAAGTWV